MTDTLGIIGLGNAGLRHARNAVALGLKAAAYDSRVDHETFSLLQPGMTLASSYDVLMDRDLLGVIVATPPEDHARRLIDLAARDVPVLCEKPLGATVKEAEEVADAWARGWRRPLAVGYQLRFHETLRRARERLKENGITRPLDARLWTSDWSRAATYQPDFLLECSHEVDCMHWLCGPMGKVRATSRSASQYYVMAVSPCGETCYYLSFNGKALGYTRDVSYGGRIAWTFNHDENERAYRAELDDFVRVCRGEKQPECTMADGIAALRTVEAIKRGAGSGQWETV